MQVFISSRNSLTGGMTSWGPARWTREMTVARSVDRVSFLEGRGQAGPGGGYAASVHWEGRVRWGPPAAAWPRGCSDLCSQPTGCGSQGTGVSTHGPSRPGEEQDSAVGRGVASTAGGGFSCRVLTAPSPLPATRPLLRTGSRCLGFMTLF